MPLFESNLHTQWHEICSQKARVDSNKITISEGYAPLIDALVRVESPHPVAYDST